VISADLKFRCILNKRLRNNRNAVVTSQLNRRQFVQNTAMAGAGFWFSTQSERALGKSPNERVAVASIGVGGKGSSDTDGAAKYGQIVALCDVDDQRLQQKAKQYPKARWATQWTPSPSALRTTLTLPQAFAQCDSESMSIARSH
jgi:hypothetical protein